MPQKSKTSLAEKVTAVRDYLNGKKGPSQIRKELGICKETLSRWVLLYKTSGVDGLIPKAENRHYPKEVKMQIIREYLNGTSSMPDLVTRYKLSDSMFVWRWIKQYNSHKDFKSKQSGSEIYMAKGQKTTLAERQEIVSYCLSNGTNYRAAMEKYSISYQQIYNWVRKYHDRGEAGLQDRRGKAKPEAKMTELDKLRAENKRLKAQLYEREMENEVIKKLIEVKGRWS